MPLVQCPVCKGHANKNDDQDGTVYCASPKCSFMGIPPKPLTEQRYFPDMPYLATVDDLQALNKDGQNCEVCDKPMRDHIWALIEPGGFVIDCSLKEE